MHVLGLKHMRVHSLIFRFFHHNHAVTFLHLFVLFILNVDFSITFFHAKSSLLVYKHLDKHYHIINIYNLKTLYHQSLLNPLFLAFICCCLEIAVYTL